MREPKKAAKPSPGNRLRSLRRALARATANGDDVAALESQISALSREVEMSSAAAKRSDQERQHALRYRKVKFFEKQKATRRLRTLDRQLESANSAARPGLLEERERVLADLEYINHYPTTKRYIALYANSEDDPRTCERRTQIREEIRCRQSGKAPGHERGGQNAASMGN